MTITKRSSTTSLHRELLFRLLLLVGMLFITVIAFAQPANDDCSTATVLGPATSCSYQSYTLEGATLTGSPYSNCSNSPSREVWFKAAVPTSGVLVVQGTTDINPIISFSIFTGTCGALTYYDCTENLVSGTGYLSISVSDPALAGTDIYIEVTRGNSNKTGNFEICSYVQEKPLNEDCNDAILMTNEKGIFEHQEYSNKFGQTTGQATASCGTFSGADVWFKTMVPSTGRLVVHAQSEEISPVLSIYTGGCNGLTYETCVTASNKTSEIILNDLSLAEEMIYIRIYADGNAAGGNFELLVLEPTQDFCAEARPLEGNKSDETFERYTNRYASTSTDGDAPACGAFQGTDIWFTMDVPASGELIIDTKPSADLSIKPILTLYKGDCSSLTQVACNEFGSANFFGAKLTVVHNPSAALPVDLVHFTANTFNSTVVLDWATASEENNDYFLIEHSTDGRNFIPIEKVEGVGTTSEIQRYDYVHENPYFGENYYRLKQVDFDGGFEYFDVAVALIHLSEEQFKLFPNPAFTADVLSLRWSEDLGDDKLVVSIVDALGQEVYLQEVENNSDREARINCTNINMNAGVYFLQLRNEQQIIAHRRFNLVVN